MPHDAQELDLFRDFLPGITEDALGEMLPHTVALERPGIQISAPLAQEADVGPVALVCTPEDVEELVVQAQEEQTEAEGQLAFFELTEWWKAEWQDMPEYTTENMKAWRTLFVHFECRDDMLQFAELISQRFAFNHRQPSVWYPPHAIKSMKHRRFVDEATQ